MEKDKALAAALSQIEKSYGKGSVMILGQRQEMNIESILQKGLDEYIKKSET